MGQLKIKILIVENTPFDLALIRKLIEEDKQQIAKSFTIAESYDQAVDVLSGNVNFDLSILDVKLDGHKSFELVKNFSNVRHRFGIIAFMTGEDIPIDIAMLAHPMMSIVKPFNREQIAIFLSRVKELLNPDSTPSPSSPPQRIGIFSIRNETIVLNVDEICSIEADNKCSTLYCFDEEENKYYLLKSRESFGDILNRLANNKQFVQCFKSWIVNTDKVTGFTAYRRGGDIYMKHKDCQKIPYSDIYKEALNARINARRF